MNSVLCREFEVICDIVDLSYDLEWTDVLGSKLTPGTQMDVPCRGPYSLSLSRNQWLMEGTSRLT